VKADIKVDEHGFGKMTVGNVVCGVQPLYQIPVEQHDRINDGAERASRGY
jgi:hypothetical protein